MTKKEKLQLEAELDELKKFTAQVEHFDSRLKAMGFVKKFQDTKSLDFESYLGKEGYVNEVIDFNFVIIRHPNSPTLDVTFYNGAYTDVYLTYDEFIKILWEHVEPRLYKKAKGLQDDILNMLNEFQNNLT